MKKKNLFLAMAAMAATAATAAQGDPFASLRIMGSYAANSLFTEEALSAQQRHPNLFGEIWFCGSSGDLFAPTEEFVAAVAKENAGMRERCHALGLDFALQDITLNHAPDGQARAHLPDSVWCVTADGRRLRGLMCPSSPEGRDYMRRRTEALIRALDIDAYWPDDDLRLDKRYCGATICFCDRCNAIFSKLTGKTWTRETLAAAVCGNPGDGAVRKAWTDQNAENLAGMAAAYRAGRDAAKPSCRIGVQVALSGHTWDGPYTRRLLEAFSRNGREKVGIRPGALYYSDENPYELAMKFADVAREAARCRKLGFVDPIAYESENWPHTGAKKNPEGQMHECALGLAAGCNALALYWGADDNAESPELNRHWLETFAREKPYLKSVRDAFEGSELSGVAIFHGSGFFDRPNWFGSDDRASGSEVRLFQNGVPLTVTEASPLVHALDAAAVAELTAADLPALFSKPVLMDHAAFCAFEDRFPKCGLFAKVSRDRSGASGDASPATAVRTYAENFGKGRFAREVNGAYLPLDPAAVKTYSSFDGVPDGAATCLVTCPEGKVVLIQHFEGPFSKRWTGYRRRAILDALDDALPGKMPVRLLTDGFAVAAVARVRPDGTPAGALLFNFGMGHTSELKVAFRDRNGAERVVTVPPLAAFASRLVPNAKEATENH